MEPQPRYTVVGAVVLGMVVLLAFGLVWLQRDSRVTSTPYLIQFRQHSLRGLQPDGKVTMRGIPVGRIKGLRISDDAESVTVSVELQPSTPVKKDTRAVIERNLLTGVASIELTDTGRDSEPIEPLPGDGGTPVIPEGPAEIESIRRDLPAVLSGAHALVTRASELLSDDNRGRFANILKSVEELARQLVTESAGIDRLREDLHVLIADGTRLARTLDETVKRIGDRPLEEATLLFADLRKLSATLDANVRQVVVTQSNNLAVITENVTRATASLTKTLEGFENPRAVLSGPPEWSFGPGEVGKP